MSVLQAGSLVLASGSPRRREILAQLGLEFTVVTSGVSEPAHTGGDPAEYASRLAALKAAAVALDLSGERESDSAYVLGADTIVVVDDAVLGKPVDDEDAVRMLMSMAGRDHDVITAVAVSSPDGGGARVIDVRTRVRFRAFDEACAIRYVESGEGRDKAGSYALQGLGGGLVRSVEGSYSNVIGLPAAETLELLTEVGALVGWP